MLQKLLSSRGDTRVFYDSHLQHENFVAETKQKIQFFQQQKLRAKKVAK